MGSKIYVKSRGEGSFSAPPMFSQKMAVFGSKNDKTILPNTFEDLTEGLEPMRPPQPPKKTYFLKILKIFLKIGNFQKNRFFGGSEGGFVISNPPTVLATKTHLSTLKSNITPLQESKTKLNIPIFFLVKSSYIFW